MCCFFLTQNKRYNLSDNKLQFLILHINLISIAPCSSKKKKNVSYLTNKDLR